MPEKAASHSLAKGGDADGTEAQDTYPAVPGMFVHHPRGDDLHSPKSVLTARWHEQSA